MRYLFTDELWAAFEPVVHKAKRHRSGQKPVLPDRRFFEALLYLARTAVPWRDLPSEFGSWDAVYNRFRRWVASGSMARLFELLTEEPSFGPVRRLLMHSTIVRAHLHAAGARRKKGGRRRKGWAEAAAASPARSW
jgi:transposase